MFKRFLAIVVFWLVIAAAFGAGRITSPLWELERQGYTLSNNFPAAFEATAQDPTKVVWQPGEQVEMKTYSFWLCATISGIKCGWGWPLNVGPKGYALVRSDGSFIYFKSHNDVVLCQDLANSFCYGADQLGSGGVYRVREVTDFNNRGRPAVILALKQ